MHCLIATLLPRAPTLGGVTGNTAPPSTRRNFTNRVRSGPERVVVTTIAKQNKRVVVFAEWQRRVVPGPKPTLEA